MLTVIAFYKFIKLNNLVALQDSLKAFCLAHSILGTVLLAEEGINSTIAGTPEAIDAFTAFLQSHTPFSDLNFRYTHATFMPFKKMKVLIKKEIVTLGIPNLYPGQKTGIKVDPSDWDTLLSEQDVFCIDTRNTYEVALGTFRDTVNPETDTFREFTRYVEQNLDPKKHKKIAMYCTGGIRCEKASSYLLENGFENVYQLHGGILNYLEKIPTEQQRFEGKCFIFDDRITV